MTQFKREVDALRPAPYNPRVISVAQRDALRRSYLHYGDLSGITFNRKSGTLVGGHQRVALYRDAKNVQIKTKPYRDVTGTVAIGYVLIPSSEGSIRMTYREVNWDADTESAARIAANSSGGQWDQKKLGKILKHL